MGRFGNGGLRRRFSRRRRCTNSYQSKSGYSQSRSSSASQSKSAQTSTDDQSIKSGTAQSTAKKTDETAAKDKAQNLLGNMFSSETPKSDTKSKSTSDSSPSNTESESKKKSGFSLDSLSNGFSKLVSGEGLKTFANATKSFEFKGKERERAEAGLAALKKMAGKDGVLTPADRENIIGQMNSALTAEKNKTVNQIAGAKIQQAKNNRGPLRRAIFPKAPLISRVGNQRRMQALNDPQHMHTARNQALGQLNQGFKDMGMETKGPVSYQRGLQNAQSMPSISLEDTNAFKDAMHMVRDKAKAMGLPQGQFKKGLPVAFLQDVLGGKPAASLLKHQVNPFGK